MLHRRNYTRYPLLEKDFRTSYDAVWASQGIGINPNDIRFLPLLFVILALSVRVAPESLAGDDRQRRLSSLRYYWSCMFFEYLTHPVTYPFLCSSSLYVTSCCDSQRFDGASSCSSTGLLPLIVRRCRLTRVNRVHAF